ncbi:hypothetical protein GCM10009717_21570 [Agromyces allii]|uniref:Uncharacterized protein n=1 Tax=Agromyces allii TaxID=393607 RepID=A0ABP5BZW4_9MICO
MSGIRYGQSLKTSLARPRENLCLAIGQAALQEVAHRARLEVDEVASLLGGTTHGDLFLTRLEEALGVTLWPRVHPISEADSDDRRLESEL